MAQNSKSPKQPQDRYASRAKSLASAVQRLRGWVGSDPSRRPELADALVELTEHRLLGHSYATAAADAQEAVRLAAQLLTENGPIGPYTVVPDATRCVTAMVHLASVQVGAGRPDVASQTMGSIDHLQQQLRGVGLAEQLTPLTGIWALACRARAALAAGEAPAANAHADDALGLLGSSSLPGEPDAVYPVIDVDRLVSDCRWATGRAEESLVHLHLAKDRYDELVSGRLTEPGRLSPALLERLAEPLFGLHRDLADRLLGTGEVDLALATRRTLVEVLQGLANRRGEPARIQLAWALADLAEDLLTAGRVEEAEVAAADAVAAAPSSPAAESARLLAVAAQARATTRTGRSADAVALIRPVITGEPPLGSPPARAVGLLAWAEALRADGDPEAAAAARAEADQIAEPAAARDLARGVVSRGAVPDTPTEAAVAEPTPEQQRETAAWLEAERAEAHRLELERMEQARIEAERRRAEQQEAERLAAEQLAAEREQAAREERLEAERQAAAEEAERVARKQRREERLEAHRLETEERALAAAEEEWRDARARGDRRAARTANERVVELLRPRAEQDPAQWGPHLLQALEELSSARLRGGDVWGSRAPAREAKALARALGR